MSDLLKKKQLKNIYKYKYILITFRHMKEIEEQLL